MTDFQIMSLASALWRQLAMPATTPELDLADWMEETANMLAQVEDNLEVDGVSLPVVAAISEAITTTREQLTSADMIVSAQEHHYIGMA